MPRLHGMSLRAAHGSQRRLSLGVQIGSLRREASEQYRVGGLNSGGSLRSASRRDGGNENRLVPALDSVHRIEHGGRNERRIASADDGIDPRVAQGDEHVLVPIGHFIGADRASQGQRQQQQQQAPAASTSKKASHTDTLSNGNVVCVTMVGHRIQRADRAPRAVPGRRGLAWR